jgi:RNA polymerase sigma factor (sigma-70 family)
MSTRLRAWFRATSVATAPSETGATDGDLVRRFAAAHDEAAFTELVRRHGPMVLATCRRVLHPDVHTADDAFQAAFLVLATKAHAVSPPERVGAFLHGVAVHVAKKARTWVSRLSPSVPSDFDRIPAAPVGADPDAADVRAKIDAALAALPAKYRSPVVLCDLEGRSRAEAAALLGWSEGALSGRLFRARKLLAGRLARRGVVVPAAGLGVLLPASAATAIVPVQLAASVIWTASLVSLGAGAAGATDGAVPASIAALAQGIPTMRYATFKLLAAAAAGLGVALGGFGLLALTAADQPTPPAAPPLAVAPAQPAPVPSGWKTTSTLTHTSAVTAVALASDFVATGTKGGVLVVWDAKTGKREETLLDGTAAGSHPIDQIQASADGKWLYLVTNGRDNFHQCSVEKKDRLFPGAGGNGQYKMYGVTADGKFWLQAFGNRVLALTENRFDENVIPFMSVTRFVHKEKIDFAAAGEADVIATVSDGVLRRWDKAQEKPVWEEKFEKFEASALAVCPLTKVIAVGGKSGEVRIYAALTGKVLATLTGHPDAVTAIGFTADGTRVVTGGADKTARVWDAENAKELAVLKGHTDRVTAVAFGADGKTIATGSADKTVRVWAAPPAAK